MRHAIEDDLRGLRDDLPTPSPQFLNDLRRGLEQQIHPRRTRRRLVVAAAAFVALGTVAYAATESPFYAAATEDAIVSNGFSVTNPTATSLGSVAPALSCQTSDVKLACSAVDPTTPGAYVLISRANVAVPSSGPVTAEPVDSNPAASGNQWLDTFATDGSRIEIRDGSPPIIACPNPAANGQVSCAPILAGDTYPTGTPIYENDVSG